MPYISLEFMNRKKKKQSAKDKLINALSQHFATLPQEEAEERIKNLREFVSANAAAHSDDHTSPEQQDYKSPTPLLARQH